MLPNKFLEGLLLFPQSCEVALLFRRAPIYEEINSLGINEKKKKEVTKLCVKLKNPQPINLRLVAVSA